VDAKKKGWESDAPHQPHFRSGVLRAPQPPHTPTGALTGFFFLSSLSRPRLRQPPPPPFQPLKKPKSTKGELDETDLAFLAKKKAEAAALKEFKEKNAKKK